ncbi:hypothetical protein NKI78_23865 [Mesorhizobium sp. M0400]|uniref:hypothetical protein n=1 Tax=Mesorhizobium sp. M0400 TaxID=2956941 RepID=UPI00333D2F41
MADIGEHQASARLVHDDADVAGNPDRPEIWILGLVDTVKLQPRLIGIRLQIECRQLRLLLLVIGEFCESGGEAVGEDSGHGLTSLMGDDERAGSFRAYANIVAELRAYPLEKFADSATTPKRHLVSCNIRFDRTSRLESNDEKPAKFVPVRSTDPSGRNHMAD